jgi:flagellar motor switch/type III secretory pathway protein FliN
LTREPTTVERDSPQSAGPSRPDHSIADAGLFGWLPKTTLRAVRVERLLTAQAPGDRLPPALGWLDGATGSAIVLSRPEILWRASGLQRPSLVVQLTATRLATRFALGIEVPLAHTIIDRMLGFDRTFAESRLQLTPVEWGIGTFLALRAIDSLADFAAQAPGDPAAPDGPLQARDIFVDRVGPDPFDPADLGAIVTIRWSVTIGSITAAVRLWLPQSVVSVWTESSARVPAVRSEWPGADGSIPGDGLDRRVPRGELAGTWRAVAGEVLMPRGLARLRVGGVLPLSGSHLSGTPASPAGRVDLVIELDGQAAGFRMAATPVAESAARLVRLESRPIYETRARDPIAGTIQEGPRMNQPSASPSSNPPSSAPMGPLDVPVTLAVELGRVNLTVTQLADLKPGDVVELARNSRTPVELTSGGRLVARGELILIDTDLGVRVTSVFL